MPTPGPLELVIILVIALLILGPGKLPEVGASLGKSIREFRKASSDVQESVKVDTDTSPLPATPPPPMNAPGATTPAVPITVPDPVAQAPAPAPAADAAPADTSDPTQTASARSTNAADSPITAG
jgi:TatA/E family protein of Tat protein translocase